MARLIGNAILRICRLLISTCKLVDGAAIAIKVGPPERTETDLYGL